MKEKDKCKDNEHGHYVIAALVILVIAAGFVFAGMDTQIQPKPAAIAQSSVIFNSPAVTFSAPVHEAGAVPQATAAAITLPLKEEKVDSLQLLIYLMALACFAIVIIYIFLVYALKEHLHHTWIAVSYWILMAAIPLSVYYTVTRKEHLPAAYAALAVTAMCLVIFVIVKPWIPPAPLPELQNINDMLRKKSSAAKGRIERISRGRRARNIELHKFRKSMEQMEKKRELFAEGVKDTDVSKIDENIKKITANGAEITRSLMDVEHAIKERENKFRAMNIRLKRWAKESKAKKKPAKEAEKAK